MDRLNTRPRKCLGYRTSNEVFFDISTVAIASRIRQAIYTFYEVVIFYMAKLSRFRPEITVKNTTINTLFIESNARCDVIRVL